MLKCSVYGGKTNICGNDYMLTLNRGFFLCPGTSAAISGIQVSVTCSDSALTPSVQALLRHNAPSSSLKIVKLEAVNATLFKQKNNKLW